MKLSRRQIRKIIAESMQQTRQFMTGTESESNVVKVSVSVRNRTFTFITPDGKRIHGDNLRDHPEFGGNVTYILNVLMGEIEKTVIGQMGTSTDPTYRIQDLKDRLTRIALDLGYDFVDFVNI